MSNMNFKQLIVSPSIAQKILTEKNNTNRPIKNRWVSFLSRQMTDGLWSESTGETLKFDADGNLIDGQHRLSAVIKSGITITFVAVYGLPPESFHFVDQTFKRSAGDTLAIAGVKNYNVTASIIQKIHLFSNTVKTERFLTQMETRLSNDEIIETYNDRRFYWDELTTRSLAVYNSINRVLTPAEIGGWIHYFHSIHEGDANTFFAAFQTTLPANHPTSVLLRRLLESKMNPYKKLTTKFKNALIIKAWNAFRKGKNVSVLRWNPEKDKFPIAV